MKHRIYIRVIYFHKVPKDLSSIIMIKTCFFSDTTTIFSSQSITDQSTRSGHKKRAEFSPSIRAEPKIKVFSRAPKLKPAVLNRSKRTDDRTKRRKEHTGVLAIHELQSLVLVAEALPVVVLAPGQVMPEHLGVEIAVAGHGGGGGGGGGPAGAADGEGPAPATEGGRPGAGEALRQGEVGAAGGDAAEVEGDRHGARARVLSRATADREGKVRMDLCDSGGGIYRLPTRVPCFLGLIFFF